MMASNYGNAGFSMGFLPGIKAFTAAVLGGIGNCAARCSAVCCWGCSNRWAPAISAS